MSNWKNLFTQIEPSKKEIELQQSNEKLIADNKILSGGLEIQIEKNRSLSREISKLKTKISELEVENVQLEFLLQKANAQINNKDCCNLI